MIVPFDCPACGEEIRGELSGEKNDATCPNCGNECAVPKAGIGPGVVLGGCFRIERKLGKTSLGQAYLGYQETMERYVRIEILPSLQAADEETLERFQREVKLTASMQHKHLLGAIDAGEDNGICYLVTQHKDGESLADLLTRKGRLDAASALRICLPIAEALAFAWNEKKMLHRNIKPQAIFLAEDGNVLLTDLGIAKTAGEQNTQLTAAGYTIGTPEYMSPEQCRAESDLDCRSDMYCLGITLYECLTGNPPFQDRSVIYVMQKQMDEPHQPVADLHPELGEACSELVDRLLEKEREERFGTWEEAIAAFKAVLKPARPKAGGKTKAVGPARAKQKAAAAAVAARSSTSPTANAERSASSAKAMLIGIAAVVAILIGLFAIVSNRARRPAAEGQQQIDLAPETPDTQVAEFGDPVIAPAAPEVAVEVPSDTPAVSGESGLAEMFEYAREYAVTHPHDYDGAIRKLAAVREQAKGTKYFLLADEEIDRLRQTKARAVAETVDALAQQVDNLAKQGKYEQALAAIDDYRGPLAEETEEGRRRLAEDLQARQRLAAEEVARQEAAKRRKLNDLRGEIARQLVGGDLREAIKAANKAVKDETYADIRQEVRQLRLLVRDIAQADQAVLTSFAADAGKTVRVELKDGAEDLTIRGVEGRTVQAQRTVEGQQGKATIGLTFAPRDLNANERLQRLAMSDSPFAMHTCAVVAWRLDEHERAREYLAATSDDDPLARALRNAMQ